MVYIRDMWLVLRELTYLSPSVPLKRGGGGTCVSFNYLLATRACFMLKFRSYRLLPDAAFQPYMPTICYHPDLIDAGNLVCTVCFAISGAELDTVLGSSSIILGLAPMSKGNERKMRRMMVSKERSRRCCLASIHVQSTV